MGDILDRRPPRFERLIRYGPDPQQFAEVRYPEGKGPFPCLLVIHGGFWRSAYDLSHISHLCQAFANEGVVTCNIEYRRVGNSGGGWPGTFQDINLATSHILNTISSDSRVDVTRTVVLGHSAGGHLALWLASRHRIPNASVLHSNTTHRHINAVSLAGVCDLRTAWREQLGGGAVAKLMGGSPTQHPDRYLAGNPIELLPIGARQVLVHGAIDDIVPFSQSERFVERAEQLGDQPDLVKLDGAGHFEPIDPESNAWSSVVKAILSQLGTG